MESLNSMMVLFGGFLSFFSPCILPILPIYFGYLSNSAKITHKDGTITYRQSKIFLSTLFFVFGISFAFLFLGITVSFVGNFFGSMKYYLSILCGIFIILFGFFQIGILKLPKFSKEKRFSLPINLNKLNYFSIFLLGFTFSFAWTPCVGPILSSVLLLVASSSSLLGSLYLILYIFGFILPFLILGIFTTGVLNFLKKNQKLLKYTIKVAGVILIVMGVLMVIQNTKVLILENKIGEINKKIFVNQKNEVMALDDLKGSFVLLSFLDRYCSGCQSEIPILEDIKKENHDNVSIVGVMKMNPNDSILSMQNYITSLSLSYPILLSIDNELAYFYEVTNYPMILLLDESGSVQKSFLGTTSKETLLNAVDSLKNECLNERMC